MTSMTFSLSNYQSGLAKKLYSPPSNFCPYFTIDPILFKGMEAKEKRWNNLQKAFYELQKRTGYKYFHKVYPLQGKTLSYSSRAFPAYRFLLPEVMTEDWLAIVDWGKYQRDHVLHQPLCGYIVLKLLDGDGIDGPFILPDGRPLLDACVDSILRWEETFFIKDFLISCGMKATDEIFKPSSNIAKMTWRIFLKEALYVAAVFHDLGYPWQYSERIQGNLDGINTSAIKRNMSVEQIIDKYGYRMLFQALQGYRMPDRACPSSWSDRVARLTDFALSNTHGFPGALGFLHLNDCLRKYPSSKQFPLRLLCVEWVAASIMLHDMGKIYWGTNKDKSGIPENPFLRLSFLKDPLSAILTLTDVIEDFERPTAVFNRLGNDVTINYDTACDKTTVEMDGKTMTIRYFMKSSQARAIKQKCLVDDKWIYFDAQYGYIDMSSLGINCVKLIAC